MSPERGVAVIRCTVAIRDGEPPQSTTRRSREAWATPRRVSVRVRRTNRAVPDLDAYWEEPDRLPLLIETDGAVCGLCLIRRRDSGWSIAEFYVRPSRRRGGVGRAAVDALAARARSEGAAFLEAKVHPNNREALPFWLRVGFSEIDPQKIGVTVTRRQL
jgi:GNAT superfamily N-acetyltransferase